MSRQKRILLMLAVVSMVISMLLSIVSVQASLAFDSPIIYYPTPEVIEPMPDFEDVPEQAFVPEAGSILLAGVGLIGLAAYAALRKLCTK